MTDEISEKEKKLFREIREQREKEERADWRPKASSIGSAWSNARKEYQEGRPKRKLKSGDKEELSHFRTYSKGISGGKRKKKSSGGSRNPIGFSIFG